MEPPTMPSSLTLVALVQQFAIARLGAGDGLPWWAAAADGLLAFVRSGDEVSIVCEEQRVPDGVRAERGYRALRVDGTLSFQATGVLASLATPLAAASVPIFVISTFDTDYILVRATTFQAAVAALAAAGHEVREDQ